MNALLTTLLLLSGALANAHHHAGHQPGVESLMGAKISAQGVKIYPDLCEAYLPNGKSFSFTHEEFGIRSRQPFYIGNPFYPDVEKL